MAPEQIEGRDADTRSDIFAFGCVLYEMLTGHKAFAGKSEASLIGAIMHASPPSVSAALPVSPPELDRLVQTCLAKDPEDRWQDLRDPLRELKWISTAGLAPRLTASGSAKGAAGRSRAIAAPPASWLLRWRPARILITRSRATPDAPAWAEWSDNAHDRQSGRHRAAERTRWHESARRLSRRSNGRLGQSRTRRLAYLDSQTRREDATRVTRDERRELSLLVARQPLARVLRSGHVETDERRRRLRAEPCRDSARSARRHMECAGCDRLLDSLWALPDARRRRSVDPGRRARSIAAGELAAIPAIPARWPSFSLCRAKRTAGAERRLCRQSRRQAGAPVSDTVQRDLRAARLSAVRQRSDARRAAVRSSDARRRRRNNRCRAERGRQFDHGGRFHVGVH